MRYRQEKQNICRHLQQNSQLYETAEGLVECAVVGKGPIVLISHGGSGGYDMGLWLAGLFGGEFQFIAPSRFGYLRSPLPADPTPEAQADLYAALLDLLKIDSIFILGLSAGGPSALQFALRHPERCRGLVMLSAISNSLPPLPFVLRLILPFILRSDFIPWCIHSLNPDFVYRSNGVNRELLAQIKPDQEKMALLSTLFTTTFPASPRREGMINDMGQAAIFPPYPLERITAPTLVIHAVDDPIVPFELGEFTARSIPGAQFLKLNQGGHFCCVTHQEQVVPIINNFLNRYGTRD